MQVSFILNTTLTDFTNWLQKHTHPSLDKKFETVEGTYTLTSVRVLSDSPDLKRISVAGSILGKEAEDIDEQADKASIDVFDFSVSRLMEDRIKVEASVIDAPSIVDYFVGELLAAIKDTWPEMDEKPQVLKPWSLLHGKSTGAKKLTEAPKVLLDRVLDTTPGFIYQRLSDFLLRKLNNETAYRSLSNSNLEIQTLKNGLDVQYYLSLRNYGGYAGIGYVNVNPINESHASVIVASLSHLNSRTVIQDQGEWKDVQVEGESFLQEFTLELALLYSDKSKQILDPVITPAQDAPERPPRQRKIQGKSGRPPLEMEDLIPRLAKAQEANELRKEHRNKPWREIAKEIEWDFGSNDAGLKMLRNARFRLEKLLVDDPDNILILVGEYRATKTN